ncbi:hypothetical protein D3C83_55850 [compost metagenome]
MMIEVLTSEKLLEQIEDDVGLPLLNDRADRTQFVGHAERLHFMSELAERRDHVVLGLPFVRLLFGEALQAVRRHQRRVHQHDDAQFALHKANQFLRL